MVSGNTPTVEVFDIMILAHLVQLRICFLLTVRFSAGQEGGSEPAQESGELQNPDRKHTHGHR